MAFKLTKKEKIESLLEKNRYFGICNYLKLHPECIEYISIEKRRIDFIKSALESNGNVLELLHNDEKNTEVCKIAIKNNISSFIFVPENIKTIDFLIYAINCDYNVLKYIKNPSEELCLIAMDQNPNSLYFIENKTENIMLKAKDIKGLYKRINMPQYYNAVLAYIKQNGNSLQYIKKEHKTFELCKAAIENSPFAIKYIPKKILLNNPELQNMK